MPKPHPKEFRDDVVRVALAREPGVRIKDIAADFGITESCFGHWLAQVACDEGRRRGSMTTELVELREARSGSACWSRRTRCCAGRRRICPRRICREMMFPLVREFAVDGVPVTVACRVLELCRPLYYRWVDTPITDGQLEEA